MKCIKIKSTVQESIPFYIYGEAIGDHSVAVQSGDHFPSGDHLRSNPGIISSPGIICGPVLSQQTTFFWNVINFSRDIGWSKLFVNFV